MANETEPQKSQSQVYHAPDTAPPKDGTKDGKNGHGDAKFPATTPDGHEGSKYAPKEDKKDEGDDKDEKDDKHPAGPLKKLLIGAAIVALLIVAAIWGWSYYINSINHVSTDDAYVTGNLVNVSPIISGTLNKLTVDEGDHVTQGQLIGRLEDSGQIASLNQARAAYQAALSQLPQAQQTLRYQQQATDANIRKAQASLQAQQAKTEGAQQQVILSRGQVLNQVRQAESQVTQAQAQAAQADAQVQAARSIVNAQRQAVVTAQRQADAAAATIKGAVANAVKTQNDQTRYAKLVEQEAVTRQQYDAATAAADSAQSQLDAARFQSAQARSQVDQARRNVNNALAQLKAAQKSADAVHQQVDVARAGLGIARANLSQITISQTNVANNLGQDAGAQADLATAQAGQTQVAVRRQEIETVKAQIAQAKAALANAQTVENDTYLRAPTTGTVIKKAVNIGSSLSPGQTILTITQGQYVYISANFKETQLRNVKPGQPVDVEVDSFPGKVFHGVVKSINEATGASQALLPPDNATGNFTKVVQRIPVRIELHPAKDGDDAKFGRKSDIENLRQGMSANPVIDVSSGRH